jgi:hypothetical protein
MRRARLIVRRRALVRAAIAGGGLAALEAEQRAPPVVAPGSMPELRVPELRVPEVRVPELRVEQLEQLAELRARGILTDEEFAAEKKRILGD